MWHALINGQVTGASYAQQINNRCFDPHRPGSTVSSVKLWLAAAPWSFIRSVVASHTGHRWRFPTHSAQVVAPAKATPNPSIEGTASGLRPPAAPHVKR
jgi:hypothetical protein